MLLINYTFSISLRALFSLQSLNLYHHSVHVMFSRLNLSVREDYFKMTDRPKGFVLTPSRLGKPPNTEEASAAKPVFTGDVNNLQNTVLEKDALGQYANP
jgi:hypothetical protein